MPKVWGYRTPQDTNQEPREESCWLGSGFQEVLATGTVPDTEVGPAFPDHTLGPC